MRVQLDLPGARDGTYDVGYGVRIPMTFEARVDRIEGFDFSLQVFVRIEMGRPGLDSMTVMRQPNGPPVTNDVLRQVPVEEVTRRVVSRALHTDRRSLRLPLPEAERKGASSLRGEERLAAAASIYRWSALLGHSAKDEIAVRLKVSTATAVRLVRQAREAGLLDDVSPARDGRKK